jgi:DNA invertase Pin-like site-specific DNA recombinase
MSMSAFRELLRIGLKITTEGTADLEGRCRFRKQNEARRIQAAQFDELQRLEAWDLTLGCRTRRAFTPISFLVVVLDERDDLGVEEVLLLQGQACVTMRPGFKALLDRIVSNGVRMVIVEDASRFARHLLTQEAGIALLVGLGVRVLTANGDDLTDSDDEFRVAMRQIMGVFSQLEKTRLVKKLKGARDRKRQATGKCGGRRNHQELRPEVVTLARELRGQGLTLRQVSDQLATAGHLTRGGKPFGPEAVKRTKPPRA